jgi:hypothetical protein
MGFATGSVASDGPLGDSVVRVTPGSGGLGPARAESNAVKTKKIGRKPPNHAPPIHNS